MTGAPRVSVIVLTRDRPAEFRRCLLALAQQRMRDFETIGVGRLAAAEAQGAPPALARRLAWTATAEENVSHSRNLGLALARGAIAAFLDDDAAPEPDWLERLLAPFDDPEVGAAGGFVRGRNGVDFQFRGAAVDPHGDLHPPGAAGAFPTVVGCNFAARTAALRALGGFDAAHRYYLDESDLCLRLVRAGWRVAFAPEAEAHHSFGPSPRRFDNRAPRDLFEIGASRAGFARRHADPEEVPGRLAAFRAAQSERLRDFVQRGRLSRREAAAALGRLDAGLEEGARRPARLGPPPPFEARPAEGPFAEPGPARPRLALLDDGRGAAALDRAARRLAASGAEVTLIRFALRPGRLRVRFEEGVWRHEGGVFGRESFDSPLMAPVASRRARRELARIRPRRDFDAAIRPADEAWRIGPLRAEPLRPPLAGFVAEPLRLGAAGGLAALV